MAPGFIRPISANVSAVFNAAVKDRLMPCNPCAASIVRPPKLEDSTRGAWEPAVVLAVQDALPKRYQLLVPLGAQCGPRQGEMLGLAVEHVDLFKRRVTVCRQVKVSPTNSLYFDLPKGAKTRLIDDVPKALLVALSEHLRAYPAVEVALPWRSLQCREEVLRLVLTGREARALNRNDINRLVWQPALRSAGLDTPREQGMHVLRHTFAASLLGAGVSVERVARLLGHADLASPRATTLTSCGAGAPDEHGDGRPLREQS